MSLSASQRCGATPGRAPPSQRPCPHDCTFAEFEAAIEHAEIIEGQVVDDAGSLKELVLVVDWTRPLHLVVLVDERLQEERIVTVYEPDPDLWSPGYRRRR